MAATNYVWDDPNRPVSIHLAMNVVRALGLEAMEGLKAVPRRGLEVGGLLLGRTEFHDGRYVISIDNYEAEESEHRSGPSYLLSENDRQHLAAALARHPDTVGMYRTQTRQQSLELQEDDVALFKHYFTQPDALFLLIQPATAQAAFFAPRDGTLELLHEFPFHPSELPVTEAPDAIVDPVADPAPAAVAAPMPAAVAATPKSRVRKYLIGALALACGMAAGALLFHYTQPRQTQSAVAPTAAQPKPATAASEEPHVALQVQPDGTALRLVWDRRAPMVRDADHAALEISDGKRVSVLALRAQELNSGTVSYWPETKDVTFRLMVFGPYGKTDDSIRAVGGIATSAPPRPVEKLPAERAQAYPPPPPPRQAPVETAAPAKPAPRQVPQGEAARAAEPESRPSPFVPAAKPPVVVVPPPASPAAAPPPSIPHESEPNVSVDSEPVSGSRVGKVVSRIPFLRRLNKSDQSFVPPSPIHEFKPHLSARERDLITDPVRINVRVYVDETGKVHYAELMSGPHHSRELAAAAVYAARHWDFIPARQGNEHVPGEVILHFQFAPPNPPPPMRAQN